MNFINQKLEFDCGPVVIVNYAKWAGLPLDESDLEWLRYALATDPENGGGELYNIQAVLKSLNPKAKENFTTDYMEPIRALDRGNAIVAAASLLVKGEVNHHIFLMYKKGSEYRGVNLVTQTAEMKLTDQHIRAMVHMTESDGLDFYFMEMYE